MRVAGFVLFLLWVTQLPAQSVAHGSPGKGSLQNASRLPYRGTAYRYFSPLSYFVLRRSYVHDKVQKTVLQAYQQCHEAMPERTFRLMECSKPKGGRMRPHRTHQNGMSVDFMTPLQRNDKPWQLLDHLGVWHYLLTFNQQAEWRLNHKVSIDYETMARHLLALDDAARKNGLKIQKVIFQIALQAPLFETTSGKILKKRGIYFVRKLSPLIDKVHDDHYHVDFV